MTDWSTPSSDSASLMPSFTYSASCAASSSRVSTILTVFISSVSLSAASGISAATVRLPAFTAPLPISAMLSRLTTFTATATPTPVSVFAVAPLALTFVSVRFSEVTAAAPPMSMSAPSSTRA